MNNRYKIFSTIYIVVMIGVLVIRLMIDKWNVQTGFKGIYQWWGYFGDASAISTIIMFLFNKFFWRFCPGFLVLSKHYEGELCSSYDYKKRLAKIEIEQTFLSISIKLITEESSSSSIVANIEKINNEECLTYMYFNQPKAYIQERSPLHYGYVIFNVANKGELKGNYFTGRKTIGYIEMKACKD